MTIEYTVHDRRTGAERGRSIQPDVSAKSENAALRECGIASREAHFCEVATRELSAAAARQYVGQQRESC